MKCLHARQQSCNSTRKKSNFIEFLIIFELNDSLKPFRINNYYLGIISTPNYPLRKREFESCGYWIKAPVNYRVEVTFDDFSFSEPYDGVEKPGIQGKCLYESVEIRKSLDIYNGSMYVNAGIIFSRNNF